jgi:hypothetical protein
LRTKPTTGDGENRRRGDKNDEQSEAGRKVAGFVHVHVARTPIEYRTADLNSDDQLLHQKNATFKRSFVTGEAEHERFHASPDFESLWCHGVAHASFLRLFAPFS